MTAPTNPESTTTPLRKPAWLRKPLGLTPHTLPVRELIRTENLKTVCQSARCPNRGECFGNGVATFMILGDRCSRGCRFCAVDTGGAGFPDKDEPWRVARGVASLGLDHVVITSVTRDDLPDGGAQHFADTITAVRQVSPNSTVEVLTPDFMGNNKAIDLVVEAAPDVYNHNVETVPSLYAKIRPAAIYKRSLALLNRVKKIDANIVTKSGIMVGLGETIEELYEVMADLREVDCDMLTIGQYLRPTTQNIPVTRYIEPELFDTFATHAKELGFKSVNSAPYVRSSYQATTRSASG